jgi:hypothetical protein
MFFATTVKIPASSGNASLIVSVAFPVSLLYRI